MPDWLKSLTSKIPGNSKYMPIARDTRKKLTHEDHRSWAMKFWLYIQTIPTRAWGEEVGIRQTIMAAKEPSDKLRLSRTWVKYESRKAKASINNRMNIREAKEWKEQRWGKKKSTGENRVVESTCYTLDCVDHAVYVVISSIL